MADPIFDAIPAELKALPQWVLWRYEDNGKPKLDKVPYQPWDGRKAASDDPKTWNAFETVKRAYEKEPDRWDGIGFVLRPPYVGLDLDHCILEDGTIEPQAEEIIKRLNSYSEKSPSEKGIHAIAKGKIPRGRKKGDFEMYQIGRYFTVTGGHVEGTPTTIEERPEVVLAVYNELFENNETSSLSPQPVATTATTTAPLPLSDDQIIALAAQAHNGDKFLRLMAGEWKGLTNQRGESLPSESEADGALVGILGFYTRDKEQILRIIQRSKLWDEKWELPDYQERTIGGALELVTETYSGDPGREVDGEGKEISEDELKDLPKSFNPRLDLHLEPSNFISKYMAYAKTTSDAYEEYHFASGLVLLSVAADRQIVISMRHGDIYPNIWIFPIGDSTVSRKTTAHKLCKLILKTKYPKKSLPSSFSPEALMDAISSTPRCFYLKDEAGSLLASLCKGYMAETRDFLAEIYECDDYYRKLKKSECLITGPYITQYLMTTPDNLKEYTTPLDLTSGWLLRYLWMYPNYPKEWRAFAEKDNSDFEKYTTIYGEYNLVIEKLSAPRRLSMTAESMLFFQEWQRGIEEAAMENADNITKALASRLMTHAVKMAALFTIGREDFDENSKIELPHIREAARLVVEYFLPIGRIIIEEVARAESKNVQDKIIGTIKRYNGLIKQRDLLRALHMKLKEVEEAIEALILSEEIELQIVKSKKGDVLYYKLRECHSDIVSHKVVYKENNEGGLYTPICGTKTLCQTGQDDSPLSSEYLDGVLVCRKIKKAIASGITDPLKLSEAVGIPVCTLARNAARYPGIDLQKAGEVLVTMGRARWWPPKIKDQKLRAEQERQAREEHFRTPNLTGMSTKEIIAAGLKHGIEEAEKRHEHKEPISCVVCGQCFEGEPI